MIFMMIQSKWVHKENRLIIVIVEQNSLNALMDVFSVSMCVMGKTTAMEERTKKIVSSTKRCLRRNPVSR